MKKDVIENIVPVVIALKHLVSYAMLRLLLTLYNLGYFRPFKLILIYYFQLEKEHSVVLKSLMLYLRELMKDYKDEVKGKRKGGIILRLSFFIICIHRANKLYVNPLQHVQFSQNCIAHVILTIP